jgi:hypothetical protein
LGYLKTRQWIHNKNISYYLDYGSTTKILFHSRTKMFIPPHLGNFLSFA